MGILATLHMAIGISTLSLFSFGACTLCRLVFGHKAAKRLHEIIMGIGMYYWMAIPGFWRLQIVGNIPSRNTPYIVVANHAMPDDRIRLRGFMDHALTSFLPFTKKYLTKRQYLSIPVFGWTQWIVRDVGVDVSSKESRQASLQECKNLLQDGSSIVIYPEGTRTPNPPYLRPFREGAFRLAYETGIPILPVTLVNTYKGMGRMMWAGSANLVMHVGEPIYITQKEDIQEIGARVHAWMETILVPSELRQERDVEKKLPSIEHDDDEFKMREKEAAAKRHDEEEVAMRRMEAEARQRRQREEEIRRQQQAQVKKAEAASSKPAEEQFEHAKQYEQAVKTTHIQEGTSMTTNFHVTAEAPKLHDRAVQGFSFADALKANMTEDMQRSMAHPKPLDVPDSVLVYPDETPAAKSAAPSLGTVADERENTPSLALRVSSEMN